MTNQPKIDSPAKLDTPGEGSELPDEPGAWFKDRREFLIHRIHGDDRLGVYVLDGDGYSVFSPITNWATGGWSKAVPSTEAEELKREVELKDEIISGYVMMVETAKNDYLKSHAELTRLTAANSRLEKERDEAKDSQDEIVNINSRHIHFLTDRLTTATARIAELESQLAERPKVEG